MDKLITKDKAYELHTKAKCDAGAIVRDISSIYIFGRSKWRCVNCGWMSNGKHTGGNRFT